MIPDLTFPTILDDDNNLFSTKDSLRLSLISDYNVGDTSIIVEDNQAIMELFPDTGIITLVENCSEPDKRAISFYYTSRTTNTFDGLSLLENFTDSYKPKNVTNVVQNVMAEHHNAIKDSLINIQKFIGLQGEKGTLPLKGNVEERINFLQSIAYFPKAWFTVDKVIGIVPFTVNFNDESFRLGTTLKNNNITFNWNFGDDNNSSVVTTTLITNGDVAHTYYKPGIYDVTLTVTNKFGSDVLKLPQLINARYEAPDFAEFDFVLNTLQIYLNNQIKTPTGYTLDIFIPTGINPSTGRTYAGEEVDNLGNPIDPIITYTWLLSDDLGHTNTTSTTAMYSNGGIYNIILKVDTQAKSYRYTSLNNYINVVEPINLWLFTFDTDSTNRIRSSEFGFFSQSFKQRQTSFTTINVNDDFLLNTNNSEQAIREFRRNTFFTISGSQISGLSGTSQIYYSSGRDAVESASLEKINIVEFNGYNEVYAQTGNIGRPWNWIAFYTDFTTYFLFGNPDVQPACLSLTNQLVNAYNVLTATNTISFLSTNNYISAASDLQQNPAEINNCDSVYGYFSVYRTAWKDYNGYFVRNSGVGTFFQLNDFYRTEPVGSDPIYYFRKLQNVAGPVKVEGQLVTLQTGLFLFDNSGSVSSFNTTTDTWQVGGPGQNSLVFRDFQDISNQSYNNLANTLLATSDKSNTAYISFDYTNKSFLSFSDIDLSFVKLTDRPNFEQWAMGTY